jgi:membrane associated rhomboid family serine protease
VPWATIAIAALMVLAQVHVGAHDEDARARYHQVGDAAAAFWAEHADTTAPPALEEYFGRTYDARLRFGSTRTLGHGLNNPFANQRRMFEGTGASTRQRTANHDVDQAELERIAEPLDRLARGLEVLSWGNVPAWGGVASLVTSSFVHGGWIHLVGDLWLLALLAPTLEAGWGAAAFLVLWLVSAVASALAVRIGSPLSAVPVVGATGALSGLLGAFFVKHAQARVRFGWFAISRLRRFELPVPVLAPLWLAWEAGLAMMLPEERGRVSALADGVALALAGAATWAIRRHGLEARFAPDVATTSESIVAADATEAAAGEPAAPAPPSAVPPPRTLPPASPLIAGLEKQARTSPDDPGPLLELVEAARSAGDRERERRAVIALMWLDLRQDRVPAALAAFDDLAANGLDHDLPDALRTDLARLFEGAGDHARAEAMYAAVHGETRRDPAAIQAVLAHAELLLARGRADEAEPLLRAAEEALWLNGEVKARIEQGRAELERHRIAAKIAEEDAAAQAARAAEAAGG